MRTISKIILEGSGLKLPEKWHIYRQFRGHNAYIRQIYEANNTIREPENRTFTNTTNYHRFSKAIKKRIGVISIMFDSECLKNYCYLNEPHGPCESDRKLYEAYGPKVRHRYHTTYRTNTSLFLAMIGNLLFYSWLNQQPNAQLNVANNKIQRTLFIHRQNAFRIYQSQLISDTLLRFIKLGCLNPHHKLVSRNKYRVELFVPWCNFLVTLENEIQAKL